MRIAALETVRIAERANVLWLLVHTDEGVTGLGETFFLPRTVEAYVHEWLAPRVIGRDPLAIGRLAEEVTGYLGWSGTGVEMRGNSAFDIALWDLWGRATGQPVAQLLGGFARDRIRTYNTCAGPEYIKDEGGQRVANWGRGQGGHDDLTAFLTDAGRLAEDLLAEGVTAMKIWPFDRAAERSGGADITGDELKAALVSFEQIRRAVGERMDVMVEFHSLWRLAPAIRIARALAPYGTCWHEDPIRVECMADLRRYADASPAPVCASETLGGRAAYAALIDSGAAGVVMLDVAWCGGLTVARDVAAMAAARRLPVAPHDCTGPVVLAASTHLSLHAPNALIQESVRAFYRGWDRDAVTAVPEVSDGMITVPPGPGLGLELNPELDRAFSVERRLSPA